MTKLQWSETHQDIGELYMDVLGPDGWTTRSNAATTEALPVAGERAVVALRDHLGRLVQVQRNIVAEHVLGLPR